jgi:hypothetical protein
MTAGTGYLDEFEEIKDVGFPKESFVIHKLPAETRSEPMSKRRTEEN